MLLLNAVSQLATRPTIQFVGDGETRLAVEAEAERLGMKDRVQFLGNRTDIPELMAKAHVFALCSKWEGFPLTILEAMRAGLPVIASRVGGVPESVIDGQNGFLVEPSDLSQLAVSVKRLIDDPLLRMRMGAAGRALYEERFTVTAMLHKTRSAYEQVLQKQ